MPFQWKVQGAPPQTAPGTCSLAEAAQHLRDKPALRPALSECSGLEAFSRGRASQDRRSSVDDQAAMYSFAVEDEQHAAPPPAPPAAEPPTPTAGFSAWQATASLNPFASLQTAAPTKPLVSQKLSASPAPRAHQLLQRSCAPTAPASPPQQVPPPPAVEFDDQSSMYSFAVDDAPPSVRQRSQDMGRYSLDNSSLRQRPPLRTHRSEAPFRRSHSVAVGALGRDDVRSDRAVEAPEVAARPRTRDPWAPLSAHPTSPTHARPSWQTSPWAALAKTASSRGEDGQQPQFPSPRQRDVHHRKAMHGAAAQAAEWRSASANSDRPSGLPAHLQGARDASVRHSSAPKLGTVPEDETGRQGKVNPRWAAMMVRMPLCLPPHEFTGSGCTCQAVTAY